MKKACTILLVALLLAPSLGAQAQAARLLPFHNLTGQWYYVDGTGTEMPGYAWKKTERFHEDLSAVQDSNGKWGYMDQAQTLMVPATYDEVTPFSGSMAAVRTGQKWTYISPGGKRAFSGQFDEATPFHEGFALVSLGGVAQLIDARGKALAIPSPWKVAGGFSDGLAPVVADGKAGYVDAKGVLAFTVTDATRVNPFSEGLAFFAAGDAYGIVDKTGKVVLAPSFEGCRQFHAGRAAVKVKGKWGYVDATGALVIAAAYDDAGDFSSERAAVALKAADGTLRWRFIDPSGAIAIPPAYSAVEQFEEGVAFVGVRLDASLDVWFYIDASGKPLPGTAWVAVNASTDFSIEKDALGFVSNDEWKIANGSFVHPQPVEEWQYACPQRLAAPNFLLQSSVVLPTEKGAYAGLVFKVNRDGSSLYQFSLSRTGEWKVYYREKEWSLESKGTVALGQGPVTLSVVCRGDVVDCFIGPTHVASVTDTHAGPQYRFVGLCLQDAASGSFDSMTVRALGPYEAVKGLDDPMALYTAPLTATSTLEDAWNKVGFGLNAFPLSGLTLFIPDSPSFPGELYMTVPGFGTGWFKTNWYGDTLSLPYIGEPIAASMKDWAIAFPQDYVKENDTVIDLDPTEYPKTIYYYLIPDLAAITPSILADVREHAPYTVEALDLNAFIRDWRALDTQYRADASAIGERYGAGIFDDDGAVVAGVVVFAGLLCTGWGLLDWAFTGEWGERQKWEVWGGLGAVGAAEVLYIGIEFAIVQPIMKGIRAKKTAELNEQYKARFKALADMLREKYPWAVKNTAPKAAGS
jgi:hypothetical protein